jgi:DNA-binding Lrp family transcriptional regulator
MADRTTATLTLEEKRLLAVAQSRFPLVAEPYAALAAETGWGEDAVRERFRHWLETGLIRRLGAVFDSRRLGYRSTLLAVKAPAARVEELAAEINAWSEVSHNYLRDDAGTGYNLWFTLTVGPREDLAEQVAALTSRLGLTDLVVLPATRLFKIRVEFPLEGALAGTAPGAHPAEDRPGEPEASAPVQEETATLSDEEWRVIRAFEADLPVIPRPFASLGSQAGVSEERALGVLAALKQRGVIRRFGATLKHFVVGYPANAMTVWRVSPEEEERVGRVLAASPLVTHCYARPVRPGWPYNLFAMLHAQSRKAVQAEAGRLAAEAGVTADAYRLLFTEREFKKERLWYGGERT